MSVGDHCLLHDSGTWTVSFTQHSAIIYFVTITLPLLHNSQSVVWSASDSQG